MEDLRGALEAAFDENPEKAADLTDGEDHAPEPEAETPEPEGEEAKGPERDPDTGRFKSKEDAPEASEAAEGEPVEQPEEGTEAEGEPQITAPATWTREGKEWFYQQPIEAQKEISRRAQEVERMYGKRSNEMEERANYYKQMDQVIEPIREVAKQHGVTESDYIARLWQADRMLAQDPVKGIQRLAQSLGVDLGQVVNGGGEGAEQSADPAYSQLDGRFQSLEGKLQQVMQQLSSQQTQGLQGEIEAFMNAKDEHGNPRHPHFEDVRGDMALFLESGRAQDMETAYDMAVHANPEIRSRLDEDRAAREAAKRAREAEEKRSKAASVTGSPSMGAEPEDAPKDSVREELMSQFERF